ncbi:hypothetical protein Hanom_Chr12g01163021 [Helianthus anomalus]
MACLRLSSVFGKLIYRCTKMTQNGDQRNSLITRTYVLCLARIGQMGEMGKWERCLNSC